MSKRAPYPVHEPWPGSPQYWRSIEERGRLEHPEQMQRENAAEFPKGHFETAPTDEAMLVSRRGLLGAMTATLALVGAEGCRRPIEKIVPYTKMPEDVIPGVPSHYATVIQRRGDAVGLLVESHEGRPTKIEGNESQSSSLGAADLVTQATILDLYDPERSTSPLKAGKPASWGDFEGDLSAKLSEFDKDQGTALRVLMPPTLSPTVLRMRAALAQRFPKARVHTWSAVNDSNLREGARIAFGEPINVLYSFDRARVILSLDSDFLQTETGNVRSTKMFASGRRLHSAHDSMSRLYVVEPAPTTTGMNADHRLRLPATDVERYARALAAELANSGVSLGDDVQRSVSKTSTAGLPAEMAREGRQGSRRQSRSRARRRRLAPAREPPCSRARDERRPRRARLVGHPFHRGGPRRARRRHRPQGADGRHRRQSGPGPRHPRRQPSLRRPGRPRLRREAVEGAAQRARFALRRRDEREVHLARAARSRVRVLGRRARARFERERPAAAHRAPVRRARRHRAARLDGERAREDRPRCGPRDRPRLLPRPARAHRLRSSGRREGRMPRQRRQRRAGPRLGPRTRMEPRARHRDGDAPAGRECPPDGSLGRRRGGDRQGRAACPGRPRSARGHVRAVPEDGGRRPREQHLAPGDAGPRHQAGLGQRGHHLAGHREGVGDREQGRHQDRGR